MSSLCRNPDVIVLGAGLIGLSIALELERRGATVLVIERGFRLQGASRAAAGMLAAEDPHNPLELQALARHSAQLYPEFLQRIARISGREVPFQTVETVQHSATGPSQVLQERSIDPRQLVDSLGFATGLLTQADRMHLWEQATVDVIRRDTEWQCRSVTSRMVSSRHLVRATGAGAFIPSQTQLSALPILPRKGQMLRVAMPDQNFLSQAHRSRDLYVVPRFAGPQAGSALIGATIEDTGFDLSLSSAALSALRCNAARLAPELAWIDDATAIEAWAGLRPHTLDDLPLLGRCNFDPTRASAAQEYVAGGHFRNGILLAPATAEIIADLILNQPPCISLTAYDPHRFSAVV